MEFKYCTLEVDGPVGTLRLNHQEVLNAVSTDMLGGLHDAIGHLVVTGKDGGWSVGGFQ